MKNRFLKTLPLRLAFLLGAAIVMIFFSNDFGLVDIQKTAVILAVGIDRDDDALILTAQLAKPDGSGQEAGGESCVNVSARGETVSDCISALFSKTGCVPKLVFCNLLLIGEEMAKEDVFAVLDPFLRNEYMPDSCLVAVSQGRAEELLSDFGILDGTSSFAISRLFADAAVKSGKVQKNTLREFFITSCGVSKSGYMPYVRAEAPGEQSAPTAGNTGTDGNSTSEGQKSADEMTFRASETALFSEGRMVALLSGEQTFVFSLIKNDVGVGVMVSEEDGNPVTVSVVSPKGNASVHDGKTTLSLSLKIRLYDRSVSSTVSDIAAAPVSEELLSRTQAQLEEEIKALFSVCCESGCDLFLLNRSFYRATGNHYEKWNGSPLSASPSVSVRIQAIR